MQNEPPQPFLWRFVALGVLVTALLSCDRAESRPMETTPRVSPPPDSTALWLGTDRIGVGTPATGAEQHVETPQAGTLPTALLEAILDRPRPAEARWGSRDVTVFASAAMPAGSLEHAFVTARVLSAPRLLLVLDGTSTAAIPFVLPGLDRTTKAPRCLQDDEGAWTEHGRAATFNDLSAADLRLRPNPSATVAEWIARIEADGLHQARRLTLATNVLDAELCAPDAAAHPERIEAARWAARARAQIDDQHLRSCTVELRHAARAYASAPTSEALENYVDLETQCGEEGAVLERLTQHLERDADDAAAWRLLGDHHAAWVSARLQHPGFDPTDASDALDLAARRSEAADAWERCLALDANANVATAERLGDAYGSPAAYWRMQSGDDAAVRARVYEARRWSVRQRLCTPYALPPCTVERPTSACCPSDPSSPAQREADEAIMAALGPAPYQQPSNSTRPETVPSSVEHSTSITPP
ncbi:MAG: hypothetical protein AAGA54_33060 [Myxococcota bacterium]